MLGKTDHYFITIVKEGNLHKASEVLYVSQPSLTKYIQRLEKQLGTSLFDRSISPMRLNDAGRLYYDFLMRREESEQKLLSQMDELSRRERGTLKLGIPSYCGQCYLPQVIHQFHARYPYIAIELYENHGQAIERALIDRQIDLGILHLPVETEALSYEDLFTETVLLATPKNSDQKSAQLCTVSLNDFQNTPFIMPHREQKLGRVVADAFCRVRFQPKVALRTENVMTMLSLVRLGMGIGFIPAGGINKLPQNIVRHVCFSRVEELEANPWKLIALRRKEYHTPAYTRYFIDLLRDYGKKSTPL